MRMPKLNCEVTNYSQKHGEYLVLQTRRTPDTQCPKQRIPMYPNTGEQFETITQFNFRILS